MSVHRTLQVCAQMDTEAWVQIAFEVPHDVKELLDEKAHSRKTSRAALIAKAIARDMEIDGEPVPQSLWLIGQRQRGRPRGT